MKHSQYFGLPLVGLLVPVRTWIRLSAAGEAPAPTATGGPDARIIRL